MKRLPISALVVTYNEGHLLEDCLKSIQFCEEIVVVDLESDDNSFQIAEKWATKAIFHERVRIVEIIRVKLINQLKHDWVLFIDPDERLSKNINLEIEKYIFQNEPIGEILAIKQNYFKNKPLKGTIWGGNGIQSRCLINKTLANFSENVHRGYKLKNNVKSILLQKNNIIHHYWMQHYYSLFEKHRRYILEEGKSMFENGKRYSMTKHVKNTILGFKHCFFNRKGYLDGFTGLFLSFFWSWYIFKSWDSLKKYEQQIHAAK